MPATKILNIAKTDTFEEVFDLFRAAEAEEAILIIPKGSKLAKQEAHFTVLKKEADNSGKTISIMTEDSKAESLAKTAGIQILSGPSATKSKTKKMSVPKITKEIEEIVSALPPEDSEEERLRSEGQVEPYTEVERPSAERATEWERGSTKAQQSVRGSTEHGVANVPEEEEESVYTQESTPEYPQASLTMAAAPRRKKLDDIIVEEPEATVPVKEDKKTVSVGIKSDLPAGKAGKKTPAAYNDHDVSKIASIWAHQSATPEDKRKLKKKFVRAPFPWRKRLPAIGIAVAVLFFAGIAYATLGSANIILQPKRETMDFKTRVTTSPDYSVVDLKQGQIPGQQFSIQKEVSDTFPLINERTVAQKAHGRIKIFNNNIGQPQRLVATTRFESQGGLVFRIPQTIIVPGATRTSDGKVAPGTIESDVAADKPGPEYNIGPSSFTIPGFKGSPNYSQFSALSISPMTGGLIGLSKVVTEEDITKAQTTLEKKLKEEVASGLKDRILDLKVISQDNIKIDPPIVNAKAGEAAEELKMTLRGSIDSVAFRESDLDVFIEDQFKNNGKLDQEHSQLSRSYENQSYNSQDSKLSFDLHITGTAAIKLDNDKIISDIKGMKEEQIKLYFNGIPEVSSVRIVLSPFWVKSIPKDTKKIELTVE